jgi:4-amino-4-deoxy-L-arabinose transferase-like glycosyltransferase
VQGSSSLRKLAHPLALIAVGFVALALGYAIVTPPWNNPDEPAHFNYVRHIAATWTLPELRPGDWDAIRLDYLKTYEFPPGESIDAIRYEAHQPPLYYLLAAPVLLVGQISGEMGSVLWLRRLSIALGLGLVLVTYRLGVETFGLRARAGGAAALLAAGIAAFIPMHTAMSAAINNDALANALGAGMVLALLLGVERGFGARGSLAVGVLAGAMVLTKLTTYGLVGLAFVVVGLAEMQRSGGARAATGWRAAGRGVGLMLLATLAVSGWWLARQGLVYGWDDLLASRRHDLVVVGQPRWADLAVEPLEHFSTTLLRSFWAQFGWMAIVVDERLYRLFGLFTALAAFGLSLRLGVRLPGFVGAQPTDAEGGTEPEPRAWKPWLLVAAALVVFGEVLYYNLSLVQPQGRYLYPALASIAILLALGWDGLLRGGPVGRALALGWLVAAGVDGAGMLVGTELPLRVVYGTAAAAGAAVALAEWRRMPLPEARVWLALGAVPALALLNLVCLVREVAPAFSG